MDPTCNQVLPCLMLPDLFMVVCYACVIVSVVMLWEILGHC